VRTRLIAAGLSLGGLLAACDGPPPIGDARELVPAAQDREPLEPLPDPPADEARVVALGKRLFGDRRLSGDGSVACASCHDLANGGADSRRFSIGARGRVGSVNAPTVFNAGQNFLQLWDGRAATLEEQVVEAVTSPVAFDTSWPELLARVGADAEYRTLFALSFRDGLTAENVKTAIATFERSLVTTGSPFDRWLAGDAGALRPIEKEGYEVFRSVGCIACHQGKNVGGNMFQRFGVFGDYFADRGGVTDADRGRFNVTHDEADRFVFRVPSLRLASRTAPYFHDGSAPSLPRAVQVMARYQLGRKLTDRQVEAIVAFLGSLAPPTGGG